MGSCVSKTGGKCVGCIRSCTGNDELRMGERTQKEMSLQDAEGGGAGKDSEPDPYLEGVREYP